MNLLQTHLWMTDLIYRAGDKIRHVMNQGLEIEEKSGFRDLVTNVDREVESFFRAEIQKKYPNHRIMGEEGQDNQFSDLKGYVWIIDPIDGTLNFIKQKDEFGIMISLFCDGVGLLGYLYDVMKDRFCFAVKGEGAYLNGKRLKPVRDVSIKESLIFVGDCVVRKEAAQTDELLQEAMAFRSIGSAALAEMAVFEGKGSVYLNYRLSPWDISPAIVIAEELGYYCHTLEGKPANLLQRDTFYLATPTAASELRSILKDIPIVR